MDCCGHSEAHVSARGPWMWNAAVDSVGAMLAGGVGPLGSTAAARTAETASTALDVLRKFISVDVHSHGGKTRHHLEGAAERRPGERHAGGIAGGGLPRRRTGRPDPSPGRGRVWRCGRFYRPELPA
jgi:hypothetical protein